MRIKACPAYRVKATEGKANDSGEFEAIVSVFNNVDWYGDVVMPGAFAKSLTDWAASGDPIPVLWSHNMFNPLFNIGAVKEAAEVYPGDARLDVEWVDDFVKSNGGLWVKGALDTGSEASEIALAARKLLKTRRVKQFSYAYDVVDGGWGEREGEEVYELRELALHEVSPTQIGANSLTQLLDAKTGNDGTASSIARSLSRMDKGELREVIELLSKSLDERNDEPSHGGKGKAEAPTGRKAEDPTPNQAGAESVRVLSNLTLAELELTAGYYG